MISVRLFGRVYDILRVWLKWLKKNQAGMTLWAVRARSSGLKSGDNKVLKNLQRLIRSGAWSPRRISAFIFVMCAFVEIVALGSNGIFKDEPYQGILPTVEAPFSKIQVGFASLGPKVPQAPLDRLLETADRFVNKTAVPYVFGGSQIGSSKVCQECSACIRARRLPANSSSDRFNQCSACRSCGLDCSNFVKHLFTEAGLSVKFATTATLNRASDLVLEEKFRFINIGDDLSDARPGDLVLKKGHVIMLIDIHPALGTVDYIHASRGSKRTPVGGIELRRGFSLRKVQRETVRILRHKDLLQPSDFEFNLTSVKRLLSSLRRPATAAN